jgi:hypothetical protein
MITNLTHGLGGDDNEKIRTGSYGIGKSIDADVIYFTNIPEIVSNVIVISPVNISTIPEIVSNVINNDFIIKELTDYMSDIDIAIDHRTEA